MFMLIVYQELLFMIAHFNPDHSVEKALSVSVFTDMEAVVETD